MPNSFLNPRRIGGQSLKALGTGIAKPPNKSGLEQEAQMQFTRMSGITPRITRAFQQKPARFVPRLKAAKGIK